MRNLKAAVPAIFRRTTFSPTVSLLHAPQTVLYDFETLGLYCRPFSRPDRPVHLLSVYAVTRRLFVFRQLSSVSGSPQL